MHTPTRPLAYRWQIKGLKRIELRIPRWTMKQATETIRIRLAEGT